VTTPSPQAIDIPDNKTCLLHTTKQLAKAADACQESYRPMCRALGPDWGPDRPIGLDHVLEVLGLNDAVWALRCVQPEESSLRDRIARSFACDCAEIALPLFEHYHPEDPRPRLAIRTARDYLAGRATAEDLVAAGDDAWDAGEAAWSAARAAWAAARAAWAAVRAAGETARTAWPAADAAGAARAAWAAVRAAGETARTAWPAADAAARIVEDADWAAWAAVRAAGETARAAARDAQAALFLAYLRGKVAQEHKVS
jgi:hypothetical protein